MKLIYRDFDNYLTNLAREIEQEYILRNDIKVIVNNIYTEDSLKGILLSIIIEDVGVELVITYDIYNFDEDPGCICTMVITYIAGYIRFILEMTRYNERYEYYEEIGEEIMIEEAVMGNFEEIKNDLIELIEFDITYYRM